MRHHHPYLHSLPSGGGGRLPLSDRRLDYPRYETPTFPPVVAVGVLDASSWLEQIDSQVKDLYQLAARTNDIPHLAWQIYSVEQYLNSKRYAFAVATRAEQSKPEERNRAQPHMQKPLG